MDEKVEYMVLIVQYKKKSKQAVENLVKDITQSINTQYGEIRRIYQGSESRIISAFESIMKLAE